ncbi:hypothetical protein [Streptosporangium sp. NPDC087985]|uniref:hypothetical protein n=1 Tax=Streptosporangium sp. NPDC087985 TaxID=3366196 RepID=UPI00380C4813
MRSDYKQAAGHYQDARDLYDQIGDRLGQANLYLSTARMEKHRKLTGEAIASYASAGRLYAEIGLIYWAEHCENAITLLKQDHP